MLNLPKKLRMAYPKIPLAQSIIQIFLAKGVTDIVISPGSRNAPLTIGFAGNPKFKCYSVADERCAAFFALGIAQQTGRPVAVLCTSGSAVLNFYPAVAEAFYSQIPLVVISADRPPEKIDIGDGQTIRQENVFLNHSLYNANLTPNASPSNDLEINTALNMAHTRRGPVHINAPFEEPLYETVKKLSIDVTLTPYARYNRSLSIEDIKASTNIWNAATRKLILVGSLEPDSIEPEIQQLLADDESIVVMTEATSNLRHPAFIGNIDRVITPFTPDDYLRMQPEILLTVGGMIVSKRIKAFLRKLRPEHHWHVDPLRAYNTFGALTHHFEIQPNEFFEQFLPFTRKVKSDYAVQASRISFRRDERHLTFVEKAPYSDLKVFSRLIPAIPQGVDVQVSNSAAIRYMQLFEIPADMKVFCNRGTSGIDGSTSTAIGAAVGSGNPTVLITGDVSFFYDSNALWNNNIPDNFKIIVVNNGGGGIFRILPGHKETPVFNTFFETEHNLNASHLAAMYKFGYMTASDDNQLKQKLAKFFKEKGRVILEIFTPTRTNDAVLKEYFAFLADPKK
jgi:2-succinyl-5-enolpyruvyl-6-hydroxy-3-cyclohexene-1-carboxylate synthase